MRERFEPGTDCGGSDGDDGRSIRFLERSPAVSPDATTGVTLYSFGLFPEATWVALLEREGFSVEVLDETGVEDERTPRRVFLARKSASA